MVTVQYYMSLIEMHLDRHLLGSEHGLFCDIDSSIRNLVMLQGYICFSNLKHGAVPGRFRELDGITNFNIMSYNDMT